MGILATTILPINFSLASQRNYYTERGMIKFALVLARCGLILMFNYESLIMFIVSLVEGSLAKESSNKSYYYDGIFGAPQYILSFTVVFRCDAREKFIGRIVIASIPMNRPDRAPDQLKYLNAIVPHDDRSISNVVLAMNRIARVVGEPTFENTKR